MSRLRMIANLVARSTSDTCYGKGAYFVFVECQDDSLFVAFGFRKLSLFIVGGRFAIPSMFPSAVRVSAAGLVARSSAGMAGAHVSFSELPDGGSSLSLAADNTSHLSPAFLSRDILPFPYVGSGSLPCAGGTRTVDKREKQSIS